MQPLFQSFLIIVSFYKLEKIIQACANNMLVK